jgi:hypothetical protein
MLLPPVFTRLGLTLGVLLAIPCSLLARLGETEEQSKARYGDPVEGLLGANDKPLIPGSKELVYNFEGWRIRAAFVNNATQKIEYVKIPENGQLKPLTDQEVEALLEAEKGTYKWREQKPKTGYDALNKLKEAFDGRTWERSDHADAQLLAKLLFVVQSRDAEKLGKELAKKTGKATPAPAKVPKF